MLLTICLLFFIVFKIKNNQKLNNFFNICIFLTGILLVIFQNFILQGYYYVDFVGSDASEFYVSHSYNILNSFFNGESIFEYISQNNIKLKYLYFIILNIIGLFPHMNTSIGAFIIEINYFLIYFIFILKIYEYLDIFNIKNNLSTKLMIFFILIYGMFPIINNFRDSLLIINLTLLVLNIGICINKKERRYFQILLNVVLLYLVRSEFVILIVPVFIFAFFMSKYKINNIYLIIVVFIIPVISKIFVLTPTLMHKIFSVYMVPNFNQINNRIISDILSSNPFSIAIYYFKNGYEWTWINTGLTYCLYFINSIIMIAVIIPTIFITLISKFDQKINRFFWIFSWSFLVFSFQIYGFVNGGLQERIKIIPFSIIIISLIFTNFCERKISKYFIIIFLYSIIVFSLIGIISFLKF